MYEILLQTLREFHNPAFSHLSEGEKEIEVSEGDTSGEGEIKVSEGDTSGEGEVEVVEGEPTE